jgi:hypothetical protein
VEGDAGPVGRVADDHPVGVVLYPDHAEQLLVEARQGTRVGQSTTSPCQRPIMLIIMPGRRNRRYR